MGFKEMVAADIKGVFLNPDEYGEPRTIILDGEKYENIIVVISGVKEQDRHQLTSDHGQGLYAATSVLHCAIADLGGRQPEKGQRIKISDDSTGQFFKPFYVTKSDCEMGMLRVELEEVSE